MAYYVTIPENSYRLPVMDVVRLLKDREQFSYDGAPHFFVDIMATDYALFLTSSDSIMYFTEGYEAIRLG